MQNKSEETEATCPGHWPKYLQVFQAAGGPQAAGRGGTLGPGGTEPPGWASGPAAAPQA